MRALAVHAAGEPATALVRTDRPVPVPGPGELVVRVSAASANFPDVLLCRGNYQVRPSLPFTPGIEVSGYVEAVGPNVDPARVGQRVLGPTVLPHGGFAAWTLIRDLEAFGVPASLDDAEAASLFIAFQTAWLGLHRRARLRPSEAVVVLGAAGGVGSAAVQVAQAAGAQVVAVVGGPAKVAAAQALGAHAVVDRLTQDWGERVRDLTLGRGADVIVDTVGGVAFDHATRCIAPEGRILVAGFASGSIPTAAVNHALLKNYSIVGIHLAAYRNRDRVILARCHRALTDLVVAGRIRPAIGATVPLEAIPDCLQRLAGGDTVGRFVADLSL